MIISNPDGFYYMIKNLQLNSNKILTSLRYNARIAFAA